MEEWRQIPDFPKYEVSSWGRVKSTFQNKEKIMKPTKSKYGYFHLTLFDVGRVERQVHRLVAEAFLPNPENKPVIDHLNRVRTDNRLENLRWATHQENRQNQQHKETNSGEHHIYLSEIGTYRASYKYEGKQYSKTFRTMEEAKVWRDEMLLCVSG